MSEEQIEEDKWIGNFRVVFSQINGGATGKSYFDGYKGAENVIKVPWVQ